MCDCVFRYSAELTNSEGQTTAESRVEKPAPPAPAHDNYVNYDVAQSVLESLARRRVSSEGVYMYITMLCI